MDNLRILENGINPSNSHRRQNTTSAAFPLITSQEPSYFEQLIIFLGGDMSDFTNCGDNVHGWNFSRDKILP